MHNYEVVYDVRGTSRVTFLVNVSHSWSLPAVIYCFHVFISVFFGYIK